LPAIALWFIFTEAHPQNSLLKDRTMARDRDYEDDEDERPRSKRRRDEDDEPEQPAKRGSRYRQDEDDDERGSRNGPVAKKMSVLGILAVLCGVMSLIVSFIPCIGSLAIGSGVIGLIMGGIGLMIAGGSNHGKGLPIAGIVLNLLSIIVAVVWIFVLTGMSGNKATTDAIAEVENAEAIKITAAQLSKEFETNIVKADATYKGKVVEVTGKVKLVSKERIGRITVEIGSNDNTIDCDFGSATQSDLAGIDVGQSVTIRGKVKGVDRKTDYVVLETCKLVKEPAPGTVPTKPLPTPVVTDAAKLVKDYSTNTLKADGLYKGKYLEIKVKMERVSNEDGKLILMAFSGDNEDFGVIQCEFPASAKDQLAKLEAKQNVTVRGTCKYEDSTITLTGCILVK